MTKLRRTFSMAIALVLFSALLAFDSEVAGACSCELRTLDEVVEESLADDRALLFTGTETGAVEEGDRLVLTFDVERVFAGPDVQPTTTLNIRLGTSCTGGSMASAGRAVFLGHRSPDSGDYFAAVCGNAFSVDEVEAIVDGLPETEGNGPPGFVVSHALANSRLALLDEQGDVLRYDTTFDRFPVGIAACPGGRRFVVASVPEDPSETYDDASVELRIDTMRIRDFKVTVERQTTLSIDDRAGPDAIESLNCHDRRGRKVTYLMASFRYDGLWGGNEYDQGYIHRWNGSELTEIDTGITRAVATNPQASLAWTVNGQTGGDLSRWNLRTGERLQTKKIPDDVSAWTIDHRGRRSIAIIGRSGKIPSNRENRGYRGSGHLLTGTFRQLELTDLPVKFDGKFPPPIFGSQSMNGLVHAIYRDRVLTIDSSDAVTTQRIRGDRFITQLAYGPTVTLTNGVPGAGIGILDADTGRTKSLEGLSRGAHVAALIQS